MEQTTDSDEAQWQNTVPQKIAETKDDAKVINESDVSAVIGIESEHASFSRVNAMRFVNNSEWEISRIQANEKGCGLVIELQNF